MCDGGLPAPKRASHTGKYWSRCTARLMAKGKPSRVTVLRRRARSYVYGAICGALDMSDYDASAMPWPKEAHQGVMDEVRRIADSFKAVR